MGESCYCKSNKKNSYHLRGRRVVEDLTRPTKLWHSSVEPVVRCLIRHPKHGRPQACGTRNSHTHRRPSFYRQSHPRNRCCHQCPAFSCSTYRCTPSGSSRGSRVASRRGRKMPRERGPCTGGARIGVREAIARASRSAGGGARSRLRQTHPKLSAAELVWIRRAKRGVRVGPLSGWDELVASAVRTTARIVHLDDNFGDETRFAAPDVDASLVQADNHRVVLVCSDQVRRHAVALRTCFEVRSAAFLLASCIIVIIIVVVISVTGVQIRHNGSVDVVLTPLPA
mmetsp:Transcript_27056/g.47120  ORF Transcript_27056/g.47120 Transcript_27056/m.47120 type:complete len:284 (+) Transcript_27056:426-1277(+)